MHAAVQLGADPLIHRPLEDEPEELPVCTKRASLLRSSFLSAISPDLLVQRPIEIVVKNADRNSLVTLSRLTAKDVATEPTSVT